MMGCKQLSIVYEFPNLSIKVLILTTLLLLFDFTVFAVWTGKVVY